MKKSIAGRLANSYFVIIISVMISGAFCVYVLSLNLKTNWEIQYVSQPSLEYLHSMRAGMQGAKKLAGSWVYMPNARDKDKLMSIVETEYPVWDSALLAISKQWTDMGETDMLMHVMDNNHRVIARLREIFARLSSPDSYLDDKLVEHASRLNDEVDSLANINNRLMTNLIARKQASMERQQELMGTLLNVLYIIIILTVGIVIIVSIVASRYARRKVSVPLVRLRDTINNIAHGDIAPVTEVSYNDEIGEMNDAVNKLIGGVLGKMSFAEQIGAANYEATFHPLSEKDKLGQALITMRDNLKASNDALRIQEKRLIYAQQLARIGNFYFDLSTGELQSSEMLDDILGLTPDFERVGINLIDHIAPEFKEEMASKAIEAIKTRKKFNESYKVRRYSDGKEIWVNTIGEYRYNSDGWAMSIFGTMQDITETKTLEIELNNAYHTAREQNNRLLNFSYIVSHNLRMHAVNIHGLLDLLDHTESEEDRKELINYMRMASAQLDETLHHLNEVVAMQNQLNIQVEPINLRNAANRAAELLMPQIADKQVEIENNIPSALTINYNPFYLDSILLNFLSNAIKYSHPDRRPHIRLECYPDSAAPGQDRRILEISDNGLGIDLGLHGDKLFGMYKTFHGNKNAKGLGLFMTKYQVEAMGGRIEVESEVDKGTTFRIFIR